MKDKLGRLWHKLESVTDRIVPENRLLIIDRQPGESEKDIDQKIARWQDGHDVGDFTGRAVGGTALIIRGQ